MVIVRATRILLRRFDTPAVLGDQQSTTLLGELVRHGASLDGRRVRSRAWSARPHSSPSR